MRALLRPLGPVSTRLYRASTVSAMATHSTAGLKLGGTRQRWSVGLLVEW